MDGAYDGRGPGITVGEVAALLAKALVLATISVVPGPYQCGAADMAVGCTYPSNQVYLSTRHWSDATSAFVYNDGAYMLNARNHELGHIVDQNFLTNADRGTFLALTGQSGRPWLTIPDSPREQFAEAFRLCLISTRYRSRHFEAYGYGPTLYQYRKVCRWMAGIGYRGTTR